MIECSVRIPVEDWRQWLAHVADTRHVRAVEVSADHLAPARPAILEVCERLGLSIFHVGDALPINLGRYFIETGFLSVDHAIQALRQGLLSRLKGGVRTASFNLGLDRITMDDGGTGLSRRMGLLSHLLEETADLEISLNVRTRLPRPFPASHEWEWAGNLIHDMNTSRCALAVDVVLGDLDNGFDVEEFVRSCASQLALLRFLYDPRPGERPDDAVFRGWSSALRHHVLDAGVIFCPSGADVLWADPVLADVDRWSVFFQDAGVRF